ncbi:MAG: tetratricopeptide repeat protein [Prevotella sp.]
MKKIMVMAAAAIMALAANAQTSPEAKAIKKMKTYDEVIAALKASEATLNNDDKAFVYNKLVDLAIKESADKEKAAIEAQLTKNADANAQLNAAKNEATYKAIDAALKCNAYDDKAKYQSKNVDRLMTLRNSMVQAGLDAYNVKDYVSATKYFGAFVETRTDKLFSKADFSNEQNFGQIAYYAALAAYFSKDFKKCDAYAEAALNSADRDSVANDVVIVKIGALEEQAKTAAIDTTTFINKMKALYNDFPTNENVFGKLAGLYEETGDKAGAKELLDVRLAKNPNDPMANAYVGQSAQNEGKFEEAIQSYKKVLAAKPDFLAVKLNLAVCYLNMTAANVDKNTDTRGNVKPDVKAKAIEDLNISKGILEELKAQDPDAQQVQWAYPLERVNYALENIK